MNMVLTCALRVQHLPDCQRRSTLRPYAEPLVEILDPQIFPLSRRNARVHEAAEPRGVTRENTGSLPSDHEQRSIDQRKSSRCRTCARQGDVFWRDVTAQLHADDIAERDDTVRAMRDRQQLGQAREPVGSLDGASIDHRDKRCTSTDGHEDKRRGSTRGTEPVDFMQKATQIIVDGHRRTEVREGRDDIHRVVPRQERGGLGDAMIAYRCAESDAKPHRVPAMCIRELKETMSQVGNPLHHCLWGGAAHRLSTVNDGARPQVCDDTVERVRRDLDAHRPRSTVSVEIQGSPRPAATRSSCVGFDEESSVDEITRHSGHCRVGHSRGSPELTARGRAPDDDAFQELTRRSRGSGTSISNDHARQSIGLCEDPQESVHHAGRCPTGVRERVSMPGIPGSASCSARARHTARPWRHGMCMSATTSAQGVPA